MKIDRKTEAHHIRLTVWNKCRHSPAIYLVYQKHDAMIEGFRNLEKGGGRQEPLVRCLVTLAA
jgi:hypothetical protein